LTIGKDMTQNGRQEKPLVVVAMSGGVDSSLAAFLLHQKGCQVVGISMKLWDFKEVGGDYHPDGKCCSLEALNDARAVCQKMGIPHYVVDIREDFRNHVISNFVQEYVQGRTPNPCVICNTRIKWQSLWRKADSLGANFLSTGHYARIRYDEKAGRFLLLKGIDSSRDQSYALWGLSQEDLRRTLFPLGDMTKKQVRALAREHNLKVAEREESQEICFVTDNDYCRFIQEWKKGDGSDPVGEIKPGPILDLKGEKLGEHKGIPFYTVGQRRGLGIAGAKPLYVVRIEPEENAIYVGENEELLQSSFVVQGVNWIAFDKLEKETECEIKIRYQHVPQKGKIYPLTEDEVMVKFSRPERAITPGQSAVNGPYRSERFCGGLWTVDLIRSVKGSSERQVRTRASSYGRSKSTFW
jgi:tRNA-specific 2-thiouridylase